MRRFDLRYLLSRIVPVPMRSTYRLVAPDGRPAAEMHDTWLQWRGRVYRHDSQPTAATA